jgi:hypothetical protein
VVFGGKNGWKLALWAGSWVSGLGGFNDMVSSKHRFGWETLRRFC